MGQIAIVMDLMKAPSLLVTPSCVHQFITLSKVLHSRKEAHQWDSMSVKLQWLLDASRAVEHLHNQHITCGTTIRSNNFVVSEQYSLKMMHCIDITGAIFEAEAIERYRYFAPELFEQEHSTTTLHSDVFALGVLFYEILERRLPYYTVQRVQDVPNLILQNQRPQFIDEKQYPKELIQLINSMWNQDASQRLSIKQVLEQLEILCKKLHLEIPSPAQHPDSLTQPKDTSVLVSKQSFVFGIVNIVASVLLLLFGFISFVFICVVNGINTFAYYDVAIGLLSAGIFLHLMICAIVPLGIVAGSFAMIKHSCLAFSARIVVTIVYIICLIIYASIFLILYLGNFTPYVIHLLTTTRNPIPTDTWIGFGFAMFFSLLLLLCCGCIIPTVMICLGIGQCIAICRVRLTNRKNKVEKS